MKIAFTTKGASWDSAMDPRFGRTEYFMIYDEENEELTHIDNRDSNNEPHGAGPKSVQKLFNFEPNVLITGNGLGGNAATALAKTEIKIFVGAVDMPAIDAYDAYKNNKLKKIK